MVYSNPVLNEREKTHGDYTQGASLIQRLKQAMHDHHTWKTLTKDKQESLDQIMTKVGRIINGDPDFDDHWKDIIGYARLILEKE